MLFNALILFFLTVSFDVSIIIMQKLNLWLHEFVGIMGMNYQHYIFQHDIFERPFHTWNLFASGTTFNKNTQPNRTKLKLWIEHSHKIHCLAFAVKTAAPEVKRQTFKLHPFTGAGIGGWNQTDGWKWSFSLSWTVNFILKVSEKNIFSSLQT